MSNTYTVEIHHQGTTQTIEVPEDKTVLAVAREAGLDLPISCEAGVCTTCAGKLLEGRVEQSDGMGLGSELQEEGYALLCVSHPLSNLKVETEKEEEVYSRQFPQP
ncbi:2Fe-2S iron-sulfur cluster-binding protein [Crocosphaera sp. Alani8]|uniref:2Fe-2S iron-sulfur cluster-binding protein n=1 Tax=Crocosphaera sp. Alani8 TaxID=3038952 RepID=UPI00313C5F81